MANSDSTPKSASPQPQSLGGGGQQYWDELDQQWKQTLTRGDKTATAAYDQDLDQWTVTAPDGSRVGWNGQDFEPISAAPSGLSRGVTSGLGMAPTARINPFQQRPLKEQIASLADPEMYFNALQAMTTGVIAAHNPWAAFFHAREIAKERAAQPETAGQPIRNIAEEAMPFVPWAGPQWTAAMEQTRRGDKRC